MQLHNIPFISHFFAAYDYGDIPCQVLKSAVSSTGKENKFCANNVFGGWDG